MPGGLLDLVLVVAVLLFALSGYREGFVVGVLSFIGFLGGGVLGARVAPTLATWDPLEGVSVLAVGLVAVFVLATVGQILATMIGARLRKRLTWRPARLVDAFAGAGVSACGVLLVAWLVGTALAASPLPQLSSQVRGSQVLQAVDGVVPSQARSYVDGFRRFVDVRDFPEVFGGLQPTRARPVAPPDTLLTRSPVVAGVRAEVLKIVGFAAACDKNKEGTGFLYAPDRLMTNAHVVAGVRSPEVEVGARRLRGTVVHFDADRDVAVVHVPGLGGSPLRFAPTPARTGDDAIVVGYPLDGPFQADAARVRERQRARAGNIYGAGSVIREIYALHARVQPGNSGGPVLDSKGRVLGVVFAAAADDPAVGYALTAAMVAPAAAQARTATEAVSTRGCS